MESRFPDISLTPPGHLHLLTLLCTYICTCWTYLYIQYNKPVVACLCLCLVLSSGGASSCLGDHGNTPIPHSRLAFHSIPTRPYLHSRLSGQRTCLLDIAPPHGLSQPASRTFSHLARLPRRHHLAASKGPPAGASPTWRRSTTCRSRALRPMIPTP